MLYKRKLLQQLGFSNREIDQLERAEKWEQKWDEAGEALIGRSQFQEFKRTSQKMAAYAERVANSVLPPSPSSTGKKGKREVASNVFAKSWGDVTVKFLAKNRMSFISGENRITRTSYELGFMNKNTNTLNTQGSVLLALSMKKKYPRSAKSSGSEQQVMKKIRRILKDTTGIKKEDPFSSINRTDGWKPLFELVDHRRADAERAKEKARRLEASKYKNKPESEDGFEDDLRGLAYREWKENESEPELPDYEDECDAAAEFLKDFNR